MDVFRTIVREPDITVRAYDVDRGVEYRVFSDSLTLDTDKVQRAVQRVPGVQTPPTT